MEMADAQTAFTMDASSGYWRVKPDDPAYLYPDSTLLNARPIVYIPQERSSKKK